MQYRRRSGVIIKDTEADKALLNILDNQKESMRDLALVAACLSSASPKLFSFIKAEVHQGVPSLQRINEILNFIHPDLNIDKPAKSKRKLLLVEEVLQVEVTDKTEDDGESKNKVEDRKDSQDKVLEQKKTEEFMPMLIENTPVKRTKTSNFQKL
jgi:hypothetical protein